MKFRPMGETRRDFLATDKVPADSGHEQPHKTSARRIRPKTAAPSGFGLAGRRSPGGWFSALGIAAQPGTSRHRARQKVINGENLSHCAARSRPIASAICQVLTCSAETSPSGGSPPGGHTCKRRESILRCISSGDRRHRRHRRRPGVDVPRLRAQGARPDPHR